MALSSLEVLKNQIIAIFSEHCCYQLIYCVRNKTKAKTKLMKFSVSRNEIKKLALSLALVPSFLALLTLGGCSTTTLPLPDMSISRDDADGALTAHEQNLLSELLDAQKETHRQDAVKEIERR